MEKNAYVRAIYDFNTCTPGELQLATGDVFRLDRQVDTNWWIGEKDGDSGAFPAAFVLPLPIPALNPGEVLFAAKESFTAEQDGDLDFNKGDLVIGKHSVDSNWYQGCCAGRQGIFPLSFVQQLHVSTYQQCDNSISQLQKPKRLARALMDLVPMLSEELPFSKGDLIDILEETDDGWFRGQVNGRIGVFPPAFVEMVNEHDVPTSSCETTSSSSRKKSKMEKCLDAARQRESSLDLPVAYNDNLDAGFHKLAKEKKDSTLGGTFSSDVCISEIAENEAATQMQDCGVMSHSELDRYGSTDLTPYARTLYQFIPAHQDELGFEAGKIVNLIGYVNADWLQGEIDAKIGMFPCRFVEIIIDCPREISATTGGFVDEGFVDSMLKNATVEDSGYKAPVHVKQFPPDTYARVLYDFNGELDGDLTVREKDVIILLWEMDGGWLEAKDFHNNIGLCPEAFITFVSRPRLEDDKVTKALQTNLQEISGESKIRSMSKTHSLPDHYVKPELKRQFDFSTSKSPASIDSLLTKNLSSLETDIKLDLIKKKTDGSASQVNTTVWPTEKPIFSNLGRSQTMPASYLASARESELPSTIFESKNVFTDECDFKRSENMKDFTKDNFMTTHTVPPPRPPRPQFSKEEPAVPRRPSPPKLSQRFEQVRRTDWYSDVVEFDQRKPIPPRPVLPQKSSIGNSEWYVESTASQNTTFPPVPTPRFSRTAASSARSSLTAPSRPPQPKQQKTNITGKRNSFDFKYVAYQFFIVTTAL